MRTVASLDPSDHQDRSNDLRLDAQGNLQVVEGLEDVRQRVIEGLQFFFTEWFLDTSRGVPYFEQVFTRPITAALANSVITAQIRNKPGVTGVRNVSSTIDPVTRGFSVSGNVQTPFGSFDFSMTQSGTI